MSKVWVRQVALVLSTGTGIGQWTWVSVRMWVWGGTAHHPQPSCPLGKGSSVLSAPETVLYKGHVRRTGQARTP